ncbi:hypothetical protein MKW98_007211 [Papaver atlanticum]|uniref:Uncharacterized protein n=1 Tax=Papaver atlanticum TaxID=357466 RepID=A0AAD4XHI6_9MAGN|nr:hypothetical protein MKW98_007211 [Papaver atlanticum]
MVGGGGKGSRSDPDCLGELIHISFAHPSSMPCQHVLMCASTGSTADAKLNALLYCPVDDRGNLKFTLQNVMKQIDVDNLERIVLPKKESGTYQPELAARDGISVTVENIRTSFVLNIRYSHPLPV